MKWQNEMDSLGLNQTNISVGLKNKIKDYNDIVKYINELKETIENPSVNDNVDELQSTLVDMEEALETADDKLVRAIQLYNKNKDKYAEMSKHLTGRPRKDGQPRKQTQTQPKPAEPPVNTTPATKTETVTVEEEKVEEGEKKKTNWWLFGGVILLSAITFGLYKARD
jgi:septum formation inhibitor MinC